MLSRRRGFGRWSAGRPRGDRRPVCRITFGVILGGRLGYVIFGNPSYFLAHPGDICHRQGGMAFHGGLWGLLPPLLFSPGGRIFRCRASVIWSPPCRLACFSDGWQISSTANYGARNAKPMGVVSPMAARCRAIQASFIEAGLEGLLLFVLLGFLIWRQSIARPGVAISVFVAGYGLRVRHRTSARARRTFGLHFFRDYYGADFALPMIASQCLRCSGYAVKMSKPSQTCRPNPSKRPALTGRIYGRRPVDPEEGYYMRRAPFGTPYDGGGDFTTPEISQMFGEFVGTGA